MAERPIPELPMPVPVTRHLNRWRSPALVSSGPPALDSAPCPHVTVPTCPLAQARVPMSTCQLVPSRLRRAHLCTFAQATGRFARLHLSIGAYT